MPATQPTAPRRGRPPLPRARDGRIARLRMRWHERQPDDTVHERIELFADGDAALWLLANWVQHQCVPHPLAIDRLKGGQWVAL